MINELLLVFSGLVMGLVAAVPIGPVNLICIRRAFTFGPVNGFVSGLGAALGDGIFAAVTGLGLTFVARLIQGYSTIIELIGSALLVYMGYRTFVAPVVPRLDDEGSVGNGSTLVRAIASTFALTITNPITLVAFTSMFASLGSLVGGVPNYRDAWLVVAGVVGGSASWWLALTSVIGLFHTKIDAALIRQISRVTGASVALFGLAGLVRLILKSL